MKHEDKQTAVAAIIEAARFKVSVTGGHVTRRDEWECDGWRFVLEKQSRPDPSKPYARYEFEFYTGTGHRKLSKVDEMAYKRDMLGAATPVHRGNVQRAYDRLKKPVAPHIADLAYSWVLDGEAINQSFIDWCGDFGSDPDSIKALDTYRACCETGEKLRKMFTREQLAALRDALQDY